jgi:hypothetical protein
MWTEGKKLLFLLLPLLHGITLQSLDKMWIIMKHHRIIGLLSLHIYLFEERGQEVESVLIMIDVIITDVIMIGAMTGAIMIGVIMIGAMTGVIMTGGMMKGAIMTDGMMKGAIMTDGMMKGAIMIGVMIDVIIIDQQKTYFLLDLKR